MQQELNASLLKDFDQNDRVKHGLPGAAYISENFRSLENSHLFSRNWVFAGFAHSILSAGDVMPLTVADQPLFLIRNDKNEVTAFHNVCRHRNLQIIDQPANCGRLIRCPYHSWSYDLCGKLKNAPYFGGGISDQAEGFKMEEHGLLPVRCEVWHDWIFINLDDSAESFETFLEPIKSLLGDNDVSQYQPVAMLEFGEVRTNWKLLVENFIEPYHVQFVHKSTTSQPLQDHYPVIEGNCLGSAVDLSEEQEGNAGAETLGVSSRYLTLFPNFVLGTYRPDQLGVHLNIPVSAGITVQSRVIYLHQDAGYSDAQIQQLKELWYKVHLEDHAMCERMQKGRHSQQAAKGGVLSPYWETSVRNFQELVAKAIRPALNS
jgi:choline monooxygenase